MSTTTIDPVQDSHKEVHQIPSATVRFAGDSGDGMQLTGEQFTRTSALLGNDVSTFPDYPAEIRAPRGTLAGVSGFQVHFSSTDIFTPGDTLDALVVMNPAALKDTGMGTKEVDRCKNFFALGLVYWLYGRDMEPTLRFLNEKFATKPDIIEANSKALQAGWNYGE